MGQSFKKHMSRASESVVVKCWKIIVLKKPLFPSLWNPGKSLNTSEIISMLGGEMSYNKTVIDLFSGGYENFSTGESDFNS